MELERLALLVEAARAGSLAAAARRLGISPMVATRRLAALEEDLGVRLMHRTTRSIALTPEGEAFMPHAQALLEEAAMARASVKSVGNGVSGVLRITASFPFGRKILGPLIADLMRANPDLRVDLLLTDSIVDIVAQGVDVAVRIAVLQENGLIAKRVGESPRGLFAAPSYLAEQGVPRTVADLARHQCLLITGASHWDFSRSSSRRVKASGRFTASSVDALHQACLSGLGIANLSEWYVQDELQQGLLVPVELSDGRPEPLSVWAVYPTTRLVAPKVRAFVSALAAQLQKGHAKG
ncbi:LysR family transcriptional regulator [Gluconacetobacter azotocaptans]|jgi:DNA-binding transcriptional LysR family regulator|uniref:LysR family transcriptional regulator n=1 Tax=Gluconacetobacter azotocaptans TaxID=142834 RepID=UPI001956D14B|nr:LysR family transcriptional regulator [Gluconacetobacter azotocaptans]MBM9401132.1 LysR family transcriptional regulator [Gluconacetobacter azotocaptans]